MFGNNQMNKFTETDQNNEEAGLVKVIGKLLFQYLIKTH